MIKVVDTNIILRFLVGDVESQYNHAKKIFLRAEKGDIDLLITPIVIAESCFVLEHFYKKSYLEISIAMQGFLSINWLNIEHKKSLRGMWLWYEKGFHFVDSYLLALKKYEGMKIVSFDKDLKKVKN